MTINISRNWAVAITTTVTVLLIGCSQDTSESLLASAKAYIAKPDNKAAVIQLKNALQKNPNQAEARFLLGKILLDSGDPAGAEKELRKARELNYPPEQVVPPLARALVRIGQFQKPHDEFGEVTLATAEANAELQTAIADGQRAQGKTNAAQRAYDKALAASPAYAPARLGTAQLMAGTGDLSRALAAVDTVLAKLPADPDALQIKANILQAQGKQDEALTLYRKVLELRPDALPAHWAVVSLLVSQNKKEEAKKALDALKQRAPAHPQTLYFQALLAYREQNLAAARDAIQQHLKAAPENLPGRLLAAAIEYDLKTYAQAEAHISKVLQAIPDHRGARRLLIVGYLRNGEHEKALEALKPILDKIGKDPAMLALAGEVYMSNGEAARAAEYFNKATYLDPADAAKRTALAVSHVVNGGGEQSFRQLEETAVTDPGVRADMVLIAAYIQKRNYDKALAAIAQLEKKQPRSPVAHYLRGSVLLGKNDVTAARRSFEQALQLDPRYVPAASSLSRLDLAENKPDAARQRFETIIAKDAGNLQALLALAHLRAATGGKAEEVSTLIRKAIAAHPTSPAPRVALIGFYVGAKDPKKAVVAAQEALAAVPGRAEVLDAAGRAYAEAGDTNQALSIFNKLAALQPSSPEAHMRIAEAQMAAKNADAALASLRKALAIKRDLLSAQRAMIAIHVDAGRSQDALAIAREVQKQRPKEAAGYIFEGDIFVARKSVNEAAAAYRAGLKNVRSTDLAIRMHRLMASAGGPSPAQFAGTWMKENPRDDIFQLYLAEAATRTGDYATAAQYYTKLLNSQPNNAIVLNNLAWVGAQLKDPRALGYAEKANKLAPNQPAFMDTLGLLLTESGETTRALEVLQQATALAPQAGTIRLNFAKTLIKAGKKDAAKKELAELIKLGEKFPQQAEAAQLMRSL